MKGRAKGTRLEFRFGGVTQIYFYLEIPLVVLIKKKQLTGFKIFDYNKDATV